MGIWSRRRTLRWLCLVLLVLAIVGGRALVAPRMPPALLPVPPAADHHMHIFSPEAARVLTISCKRLGWLKCPPILAIKASTGQDAVDALDRAGVQRGVLLSTAYMFGSPEVAGLGLDVGKETRQENEFVVDQAQAHCDRLAAFISVAPLSPNAVDEVAYWAGTGRATGLKLHLQNSDFSFRSPEQVRKLAAIVATAGKARFPMIIHLHTRAPDFGPQDVEIFLREVLPLALGTPVQIAHAAGEGGLNAPSLAALGVFADAAKKDPSATASLYFDLAMVPDLALGIVTIKASAGKVVALQGLMRRIGMDRFLLGSDWTSPRDLRAYYADERAAFDLTDAE